LNKNYHIKISVSLPVKMVEKLDKKTTYKGRSRSKYIADAITQRIEAREIQYSDIPLDELLKVTIARFGNTPRDLLMKEIIRNYLFPVNNDEKKPDYK